VPTITAVGMAKPNVQGQAITMTDIPNCNYALYCKNKPSPKLTRCGSFLLKAKIAKKQKL
jgi:hypothetical protein